MSESLPNPRLQRTRFALLRSPLSGRPSGGAISVDRCHPLS